jgi:hypothetical protein
MRIAQSSDISSITLTGNQTNGIGTGSYIIVERIDADGGTVTGIINATDTTDCTGPDTGGLQSQGGAWVEKQLRVGGDVTLVGGKYLYLRGDATTNGSVRIRSQSDNNAILESRIAGSWITMEAWSVA